MSVSEMFMDGVKRHADSTYLPNSVRHWSELDWNCAASPNCFEEAKIAKEFFNILLKPLEALYGNCRGLPPGKFTWICPSNNQDSADSLSFNANLSALSFQSKSSSGKCWMMDPGWGSANLFACKAEEKPWLNTARSLTFLTFVFPKNYSFSRPGLQADKSLYAPPKWDPECCPIPSDLTHVLQKVSEEHNSQEIDAISVKELEVLANNSNRYEFDSSFNFGHFLQKSLNLQAWAQDKDFGLLHAFAAAAKKQRGPDTNASSDSQQSNGFSFGLMTGVIGAISAVSLLLISQKQKKQEEKMPESHNPIKAQVSRSR